MLARRSVEAKSFGQRAVWVAIVALAVSGSCMEGAQKQPAMPELPPFVFVIETLSIGKGVPDAAREALGTSRTMLEEKKAGGCVLSFSEAYFGLEGETRLQVEFADPEIGREVYGKIRELTEGVDLINVKEIQGGPGQRQR